MRIHEIYSQEHKYLHDYLKHTNFDPYDFTYEMGQWLEKEWGSVENMNADLEINIEADDFDDLDGDQCSQIYEALPPHEKESCKKYSEDASMADDPANAPSYMHMSLERRIPRTTWLIHFSDDADNIVHHGFKYGTDDMSKLGLTTFYKNGVGSKSGTGWNFAFEALSRSALNASSTRGSGPKYGRNAVMFMSSGVEVYHYADEEHQVIFQGNTVNPKNMVYLENIEGDWCVMPRNGNRPVFKSNPEKPNGFEQAQKWVIAHYAQYRNAL